MIAKINGEYTIPVFSSEEICFFDIQMQELVLQVDLTITEDVEALKTELQILDGTLCTIVIIDDSNEEIITYDEYMIKYVKDNIDAVTRTVAINFQKHILTDI